MDIHVIDTNNAQTGTGPIYAHTNKEESMRLKAANQHLSADDYHTFLKASKDDQAPYRAQYAPAAQKSIGKISDVTRTSPTPAASLLSFISRWRKSLESRIAVKEQDKRQIEPHNSRDKPQRDENYTLPAELASFITGNPASSIDPLHFRLTNAAATSLYQRLDERALRLRARKEVEIRFRYGQYSPFSTIENMKADVLNTSQGAEVIDKGEVGSKERERVARMQRRGRMLENDALVKETYTEHAMMEEMRFNENFHRLDFFEWRAGPRKYCKHRIEDFWMVGEERNRCRVCTRELESFNFRCWRCKLVACHACHYALSDAWTRLEEEGREKGGLQKIVE